LPPTESLILPPYYPLLTSLNASAYVKTSAVAKAMAGQVGGAGTDRGNRRLLFAEGAVSNGLLKILPLLQGDLFVNPTFNLIEKHFNLWNRIFFVAWEA
jgi:hypothetical protein